MNKGDRVIIHNRTTTGDSMAEGMATLIKHYPEYDDNPEFAEKWDVRFDNGETATRWIRPQR